MNLFCIFIKINVSLHKVFCLFFRTLRAKTFKPFCSDELSPKRLKTVKPENPQVLVKKKTSRMKRNSSTMAQFISS